MDSSVPPLTDSVSPVCLVCDTFDSHPQRCELSCFQFKHHGGGNRSDVTAGSLVNLVVHIAPSNAPTVDPEPERDCVIQDNQSIIFLASLPDSLL